MEACYVHHGKSNEAFLKEHESKRLVVQSQLIDYYSHLEGYCYGKDIPVCAPGDKFPTRFRHSDTQTEAESDSSDKSLKRGNIQPASLQKKRQGKSSRKMHMSMDSMFDNLCTKRSISKNNPEYDESLLVTQFHVSLSNIMPNSSGNVAGRKIRRADNPSLVFRLDRTLSEASTKVMMDLVASAVQELNQLAKDGRKLNSERLVCNGGSRYRLEVVSTHEEFDAAVYGGKGNQKVEGCNVKNSRVCVPEPKGPGAVSGKKDESGAKLEVKRKDIVTSALKKQSDKESKANKRKLSQDETEPSNKRSKKADDKDRGSKKKCCGCSRDLVSFVTCVMCQKPCHPGCTEPKGAEVVTCRRCNMKKTKVTFCELGSMCQNGKEKSANLVRCCNCGKMVHAMAGCCYQTSMSCGKKKPRTIAICEECSDVETVVK
jgi:hypothetical protein